MSGGAVISAETRRADAGNIKVRAGRLIDLEDSAVTTSVAGGIAGGGNIFIDPRFVVLNDSRIVANAKEGAGGNIRIVPENFVASPDSLVDASSELGIDGTVVVSTPEVDLTGGLVVLDAALLNAASQLRERCAVRRDIGASSFTAAGRGGLPGSPDGPITSTYRFGEAARSDGERAARVPRSGADGSGPGQEGVERTSGPEAVVALLGTATGGGEAVRAPVLLVQPCAGAL